MSIFFVLSIFNFKVTENRIIYGHVLFLFALFLTIGGSMISTGIMLTSYPAKYPHVCNICGVEVTFNRKYPGNGYRDKKE